MLTGGPGQLHAGFTVDGGKVAGSGGAVEQGASLQHEGGGGGVSEEVVSSGGVEHIQCRGVLRAADVKVIYRHIRRRDRPSRLIQRRSSQLSTQPRLGKLFEGGVYCTQPRRMRRLLFKGVNYSRSKTIRGNTVIG